MKRLLFPLITLLLASNVYATTVQASLDEESTESSMQQSDTPVQIATGEQKTNKDSFRDHWTVGLKGGVNYFSLTPEQASPKEGQGGHYGFLSDVSQQFAVFSEYSFDSGWGLGAYVGNYSFNRHAVLGSSIEFGVYSHMNVLECFAWRQAPPIARRFHLFWDAGLGVGAMWQINQIAGDASSDKIVWRAAAVLRTALQFEFMVRPHWGLMFEGEYHGYARPLRYYQDVAFHSYPWINAGMISFGVRYYFDNRKKAYDPRLDENDMPIRQPKAKVAPAPKNAIYVNVTVTPEMIEEAKRSGNKSFSVQATGMGSDSPAVQVVPLKQSQDIENALKVLEEQGVGTVLINSIRFDRDDQLTDDSMRQLDKVAGSLLANRLWQNVDILYMCHKQATARAAVIATYLRAKGIRNISVKGFDTQVNDATSDLVITIK